MDREAELKERVVKAAIEHEVARRHMISWLSSAGEGEGFATVSAANRHLSSAVDALLEWRRMQAKEKEV